MKSNNEIVDYIIKNIKIDEFIKKVISLSTKESMEDLRQYILLYLLEYNNVKLNILYNKRILPQFIMKVILNQRNYYKSFYNEYCKNKCHDDNIIEKETYDTHIDSIEKNRKLDFIDNELSKKDIDKELYVRYGVYKVYLTKKYSIKELSDKYGLSYSTLHKLIKETKKIIRDKYDEHCDNTSDYINY